MNKLVITIIGASALALSTVSIAANDNNSTAPTSGFFVTAGAGYAGTTGSAIDGIQVAQDLGSKAFDVNESNFMWKLGAGYNLNKHFGLEADFISMPNVSTTGKGDFVKADKTKYIKNAWDIALLGKVMAPINDAISIDLKAGAAYASYKAGDGIVGTGIVINGKDVAAGKKVGQIVPVVGADIDYAIGDHVAVGVGGMYMFEVNKTPASYTTSINLTYTL